MGRPRIDAEVRYRIMCLRSQGKSLDKIWAEIHPDASRGTVQKHIKEYDKLPEEQKRLIQPFRWYLSGRYGLPWEAGAFLAEVFYYVERLREEERAVVEYGKKQNPLRRGSLTPRLTVRDALWCWRVHLLVPREKPEDVYYIARPFVLRELFHDVLGAPLEMDDLDAWVMYQPWVNEQRRVAYDEAVAAGAIPAMPDESEEMAQLEERLTR